MQVQRFRRQKSGVSKCQYHTTVSTGTHQWRHVCDMYTNMQDIKTQKPSLLGRLIRDKQERALISAIFEMMVGKRKRNSRQAH
jgi:hypothetical protein